MKPVLVVGSNSFSGASFVNYLLSRGVEVIGTSRSTEPVSAFLPYRWDDYSDYQFHQLDLNHHLDQIIDLISENSCEYVLNFAAQSMVGESWLHPEDWFMTNTVSTIKFHDSLRKLKQLKRYVHVSTPEVYGSCSGFVDEQFPFKPSTPYAVSRAAADMSLKTFRDAYGFPVITTRAANVYGPGQQLYRIIPRTILFILLGRKLQLHGGGASTRSFIHMKDVSEATWKICLDGSDGETYHISTKDVISIRDLVEKICKRLDVKFNDYVEIVGDRLGKDSAYHLDSAKLRNELGWIDRVTLDDGIDDCIRWMKDNLEVLKLQNFDYIHKP